MPHQLEITVKETVADVEGRTICNKAADYFGIQIDSVRTISILTMDVALTDAQKEAAAEQIFINPVTQQGTFEPLDLPFDWSVWVGFRPGVKDTAGETALEAMIDVLGLTPSADEAVYTSKRFCFSGANLQREDMEKVAGELLANDIIQQWRVFEKSEWSPQEGVGMVIPKVDLQHHRNHLRDLNWSIDCPNNLKLLEDHFVLTLYLLVGWKHRIHISVGHYCLDRKYSLIDYWSNSGMSDLHSDLYPK